MTKKGEKKLDHQALKRRAMFGAAREEYPVCLYPLDRTGAAQCPEPAIKAHSIQKSGKLAEIVEGDFVYAFRLRPEFGDPPALPDFRLVSHNLATTFLGLCKEHDNGLFEPIDNSPIALGDEEHVFLLTYRTVLKECHEALTLEKQTAQAYDEMVAGGAVDPSDTVSRELKESAARNARMLGEEKREMDLIYLDGAYGRVGREVVWLPEADPSLAASSYVSSGAVEFAGRMGRQRFCAINVFPQDDRHAAVFSYRKGHGLLARRTLMGELRSRPERDREQVASRLVLRNCTDPVLRPGAYDAFPEEQKDAIRGYYLKTAMLEHGAASPQFTPNLQRRLAEKVEKATAVRADDARINLFRAVA